MSDTRPIWRGTKRSHNSSVSWYSTRVKFVPVRSSNCAVLWTIGPSPLNVWMKTQRRRGCFQTSQGPLADRPRRLMIGSPSTQQVTATATSYSSIKVRKHCYRDISKTKRTTRLSRNQRMWRWVWGMLISGIIASHRRLSFQHHIQN